jgi:hypothetical protein
MPGAVSSRPFIPVGSFKGKGAKDRAKSAAKDLTDFTGVAWEAKPLGAKKQKGNSYAIARVV